MKPSVLILPGYQGSGETHWQSHWERLHPDFLRVEQCDWEHPVASEWAEKLEKTLRQCEQPVVLVAHSIACLVLAHWAAKAHTVIKGALIVAPPDPQESIFPSIAEGFEKTPMQRFDFPSILLASSNDPYASLAYAESLAHAWGSQFFNLGNLGHINTASNLGRWDEGYAFLETLLHT
jgi:hypothetical protein